MSTIKNRQTLPYCHFNKVIKEPGTNFQSPAFSQKHAKNVCDTTDQYLTKFHFGSTQDSKEVSNKSNYHYSAMLMMKSQIFKFTDFTKT